MKKKNPIKPKASRQYWINGSGTVTMKERYFWYPSELRKLASFALRSADWIEFKNKKGKTQ